MNQVKVVDVLKDVCSGRMGMEGRRGIKKVAAGRGVVGVVL